jgi:uncharacterized protein (DUF362 family)
LIRKSRVALVHSSAVVDGITAMEGNGPRSGDPVNLNVLLFSQDPVAREAVMCRLIDLDPEHVPTQARPGMGTGHLSARRN